MEDVDVCVKLKLKEDPIFNLSVSSDEGGAKKKMKLDLEGHENSVKLDLEGYENSVKLGDEEEEEEEEEDDIDMNDLFGMNDVKNQRRMEEYFKRQEEETKELVSQVCSAPFDPIDVADARRIVVRLSRIRHLGLHVPDFRGFVDDCYNRNVFKLYDFPRDPRLGGHSHWVGDAIGEDDQLPAKFALDYYRSHCNPDSRLQLVKVEKISCYPDCEPWYYHTFTARDENTGEAKTYQAQVLEYAERQFMLGLLRVKDPQKDHVLAVIQLIEDEDEEEGGGGGHSAGNLVDSAEK